MGYLLHLIKLCFAIPVFMFFFFWTIIFKRNEKIEDQIEDKHEIAYKEEDHENDDKQRLWFADLSNLERIRVISIVYANQKFQPHKPWNPWRRKKLG